MEQLSSHCWYSADHNTILGVASFNGDFVYDGIKNFYDRDNALALVTDIVLLESEEGDLYGLLDHRLKKTFQLASEKFHHVYVMNDVANINEMAQRYNALHHSNVQTCGSTEFNLLYRSFSFHLDRTYRPLNVSPVRHFVNLNGVPKYFRARIVDDIIENKLLSTTFWSWNKRHHTDRVNIHFSNLKNFDPNITKNLDTSGTMLETVHNSQEKLPMEYHLALIDIFAESIPDNFGGVFITEKTWKPILGEKPFLGFNERHYYRTLEGYGIKLYRSLFDYAFDDIEDPEERYSGYIENVIRLGNMQFEDVQRLVLGESSNLRANRITLEKLQIELPKKLQPFSHMQNICQVLKLWYSQADMFR